MAIPPDLKPTAIDEWPDVQRLAEHAAATGEPLLLQRDGKDVAVIVTVELAKDHGLREAVTEADLAAMKAAAGAWADLDTDAMIEEIYERRGRPATSSVGM